MPALLAFPAFPAFPAFVRTTVAALPAASAPLMAATPAAVAASRASCAAAAACADRVNRAPCFCARRFPGVARALAAAMTARFFAAAVVFGAAALAADVASSLRRCWSATAIAERAPPSYFTFRAERGALVVALDGALLLRVPRGVCIFERSSRCRSSDLASNGRISELLFI